MIDYKSEHKKKFKELKDLKQQITTLENEVRNLFKKTIEIDLKEKLRINSGGLNIEVIRDFLCKDADAKTIGLQNIPIGIQGYGPWTMNGNDENDFESFLVNKGFKVKNITDPKVQYLILGSSKVDALEVYQQIQASIDEGFELFIYTQELFVAWLISGINPLQEWTEEELLISVSDHDPMQSVIDHEEFIWPEITEANTNNDKYSIKDFEWDGSLSEESPLGKMGYTVRVDSISVVKRREILKNAYLTSQMDRYLMDKSDRERWGKANSAQRLYAMARLISWLIGFQGTTKPVAREKWKEDLIWLKSNFYQADKGMKFSWPRTNLTDINLKKIKERPKPASTQTALNPASAWPFPNGSRP